MLDRCGHVLVKLGKLLFVATRLAKFLLKITAEQIPYDRNIIFVIHHHYFPCRFKIPGVPVKKAIVLKPQHFFYLIGIDWLSIGRKAHHFVFISIVRESEKLSEGGIECSARHWEIY